MNLNIRNNILAGFLLIFCASIAIISIFRQNKLDRTQRLTVGEVYHYSVGGRGNAGGIWIDYFFVLDGIRIEGSSRYLSNEIKYENLNKVLNMKIPVVYSFKDPSISSLMLLPKDFTKRGIAFPDSLNWIIECLK